MMHVVAPMLIGVFIYVLFRDKNLLIFTWFQVLGLDDYINYLRINIPLNNHFPKWLIYSLPDGIWIYSLTSLMLINWYSSLNKVKYFWIMIGPLIGLSLEFGQLIHIIPGTYDTNDFIICLFSSFIPFLFLNHNKERKTI